MKLLALADAHRLHREQAMEARWPNRDRVLLSAGHASMLLYSMLHLTGYDLPMEELKRFRQWGSRTPGHPEHRHTAGVEATIRESKDRRLLFILNTLGEPTAAFEVPSGSSLLSDGSRRGDRLVLPAYGCCIIELA